MAPAMERGSYQEKQPDMGRLITYDFSGIAPYVTLTLGHPDASQDRVGCTKRHPDESQGQLYFSDKES